MVALRVIGETQKQIKCGNNQPVVVIAYERSWRLQQSRGDMALYNRTGVIWRFTTEQGRYGALQQNRGDMALYNRAGAIRPLLRPIS